MNHPATPRRRLVVAGRVAASAAATLAVAVVVALASLGGPATADSSAAKPRAKAGSGALTPKYRGRPCPDPVGHKVTQCRLGIHGTPDLGRIRWGQLFDREVTISNVVESLVVNPAAGGSADWPLIDSLAQPMGRIAYNPVSRRFRLTDLAGKSYSVIAINSRGHGCAASDRQSKTHTLLQIIAPKVPSSGTQAFVDLRALDPASAAHRNFLRERGGGSGCGPSGPERGKLRKLANPDVGAKAHTRLSNGTINTVTEYDAKAPFGGTVYFMANTTQVPVGGIARGMIRVGTRIAKVDRFRKCDPSSDGTLTWNYWSIRTGNRARPRIYGWIPARCR